MRRTLPVCLLVTVLVAACAPFKAYDGPLRSDGEVAILRTVAGERGARVSFERLDGERLWPGREAMAVLPGEHAVVVLFAEEGRPSTGLMRHLGDLTDAFDGPFDGCARVVAIFEAGHAYRFAVSDEHGLSVVRTDDGTVVATTALLVSPALHRCPQF
ncbi:MAG: hypothetical protein RIE31_04945 [Alphaproteobacteria bacterium]